MNLSIETNSTLNDSVTWSAAINRLNFRKRTCTTFIPKEIDSKYCVCNYKHSESEIPDHLHETWNWEKHTKQEETNCYGLLSPSNNPYLRCDIETELEHLCFVLFGAWCVAVPGLIMQMIGDADSTPNIKIEKELLQGISDAAVASDAWIITNGYREESISELIGEIAYDSRIKNPDINFSAIAVGKWGNIQDCHKLEKRNSKDQTTVRKGYGQYKLESNHTHYIFFDDGTCNSLDTGEFASNLARQISRGARRKIPLITVLVGGTLHALPLILTNLEREIPTVIVNGSGSFADILCKYLKSTESFYKLTKDGNMNITDQDEALNDDDDDPGVAMIDEIFPNDDDNESSTSLIKCSLRYALRPLGKSRTEFVNDVRKLYNIIRQQEYDAQGKRLSAGELFTLDEEKAFGKYLYQFVNCLTTPLRENIHVFSVNSSKSLKETIYYAFVQARNNLSRTEKKPEINIDEEVHLALRWSIGHTTDNQSMNTTKILKDTNKIEPNRLLLIGALSKNLLMFVMNFVKLDIDFAVLFGPTHNSSARIDTHWSRNHYYLKDLYSNAKRKNRDPLYLLDQINTKLNFTEEKHLIIVLKELVGDVMHPIYRDQSKRGSTLLKLQENTDLEKTDAEYVYRDLFLWCVLTYRLDMAKIFLSQMKTRICSALIASKILRSFRAYAPDQATKDTLSIKANEFETYAIEFVRYLYGGVTCLQMAIAADDKKFLHEDACQSLLTNIWYDKVDPVREINRLIINILTMGIPQLFISIYQKRSDQYSRIEQDPHVITTVRPQRRLKKSGIDYTDDYDLNETVFQNFLHFHNRPIVKYCYNCFGYALFLFFFSYFMLYKFNPPSKKIPSIHWAEIVTIITVTTMLFEEIRELCSQDAQSLLGKISAYFNLKNRISNLFLVLPAYLLFYIGLVLRFTQTNAESFASARIIMAIDLELWFIRSVLFIGIAPNLGPKLVMIRQMTNDLLLFIIIIIIFMFGYGITSRTMIAYDSIEFNARTFFRDVIYPVYYFVLGSFDDERTKLDGARDANTILATHVIFALHMLFVNILLINLLIALFSFKINDVQTQARYIWAYDRCEIIRSYHARPALFPPFTFLILIIRYLQWCWKKFYRNCYAKQKVFYESSKCFKMIPINDAIDRAWSEFERYSTNDYIRQLLDTQLAALTKGITTDITSESSTTNADESKRIKSILSDLQNDFEYSQSEIENKLELMKSSITELQSQYTQMENRFDRSMKDMKKVETALNWMMTTMAESNKSSLEPPLIRDRSRTNSISQQQPQIETKSTRSNQGPSVQHTSNNDDQA